MEQHRRAARPRALRPSPAGGKRACDAGRRRRHRGHRRALTTARSTASANRLAHLLGQQGVGRGALAAVCLERTADMPMALAAVLKAGAAYVPLDPTHPEERLRYILEDAEVSCVVTTRRLLPIFEDVRGEDRPAGRDPCAACSNSRAAATAVAVQPDDLAYVIYTSGSTGRPKGVEIEHRNVVSFLEAMRRDPV